MDLSKNYMSEEQLVVFNLLDEEFGVAINQVKEIIRVPEITKIPNAHDYMEGIINLRGKVISVVNLKKIFGLSNPSYKDDVKIIIIEANEAIIGILVDDVQEVTKINSENIEPAPENILGMGNSYIRGIGKINNDRLLILLELFNILGSDEINDINNSCKNYNSTIASSPR